MTSPTTWAHFLKAAAGSSRSCCIAIKDAPVDRLEPVARVRQRAMHDGGQRIGEIALLERLA